MDALLIQKKFLDKIFSGSKTWEIRGSKTYKRGTIGLIQSKSGLIVGECKLVDCIGPLTLNDFLKHKDKHQSKNTKLSYKKTYAWVLSDVIHYKTPKPYTHPQGAIVWVRV